MLYLKGAVLAGCGGCECNLEVDARRENCMSEFLLLHLQNFWERGNEGDPPKAQLPRVRALAEGDDRYATSMTPFRRLTFEGKLSAAASGFAKENPLQRSECVLFICHLATWHSAPSIQAFRPSGRGHRRHEEARAHWRAQL